MIFTKTSLIFTLSVLLLPSYSLINCSEDDEAAPNKPYALSAIYLEKLAKNEKIIYFKVKDYNETKLRSPLPSVETYLNDYERDVLSKRITPSDIVSNPISSIKMIRRLSVILRPALGDIMNQDKEETYSKLLELIASLEEEAELPNHTEYQDALEAIMQLQYFYDLQSKEVQRGILHFQDHYIVTGIPLTNDEAHEIAEFAVNSEYFYLAMEWLNLLESLPPHTHLKDWELTNVTRLTEKVVETHDKNFDENLKNENPYMYVEKLLGKAGKEMPLTLKRKLSDKSKESGQEILAHNLGSFTFSHLALCNGQHLKDATSESNLYCWLDTRRNPYFIINPLRMELLNEDPMLLLIHNVIPNHWIEKLRNVSNTKFQPGPREVDSGQTYRSAIYAWLDDEEYPSVPLPRLHELIFDLNVRGSGASEKLQIAAYALGAHVSLHVDYLGGTQLDNINADYKEVADSILDPSEDENEERKRIGDRISTFLIYMTNVEMGGYTAFPKLKVFVKPEKGSAVFWYTSLRNGKVDHRTIHGACPCLYGQKMIMTKWVHQWANFLKRPCAMDPNL